MLDEKTKKSRTLLRNRAGVLRKLENGLEKPMIVLGVAWLVLLVLEFTNGLSPGLQHLSTGIWIAFVCEFLIRFAIAPAKGRFLRKNWLTVIALIVPALRVFRIVRVVRLLRVARATRGLRMVRLVTSINRGMSALGATLRHNKFGYVMGLTFLIAFLSAAGIYSLEKGGGGNSRFESYGSSLWWTAMMMTTMGADFFPQTPEGRLLSLLLAVYAFAIWGYVTATIATLFLGGTKQQQSLASQESQLSELTAEVKRLREDVKQLKGSLGNEH